MKRVLNIILLSTWISFSASKSVVIECTFPCLEDSNDVCEVNTHFVKCKQRTNKTKWILKDAKSLPEYVGGDLVDLGQTCQTAPFPKLKDASHLSANSSETILDWPPSSPSETYDEYYSNCAKSLYCDRANICVQQLAHGEVCESDNQCFQGICNQNTCQEDSSRKEQPHSTYNTIHIILTVVGVVLFFGLLFGAYMFKRTKKRRRLLQQQNKLNDKEQPQQPTTTPTTISFHKKSTATSRSNSSSSTTGGGGGGDGSTSSQHHNSNMLLLHPSYDPAFHSTASTTSSVVATPSSISHNHTPSRQQQELQLQLQRQLQPATAAASLPPPPYSP